MNGHVFSRTNTVSSCYPDVKKTFLTADGKEDGASSYDAPGTSAIIWLVDDIFFELKASDEVVACLAKSDTISSKRSRLTGRSGQLQPRTLNQLLANIHPFMGKLFVNGHGKGTVLRRPHISMHSMRGDTSHGAHRKVYNEWSNLTSERYFEVGTVLGFLVCVTGPNTDKPSDRIVPMIEKCVDSGIERIAARQNCEQLGEYVRRIVIGTVKARSRCAEKTVPIIVDYSETVLCSGSGNALSVELLRMGIDDER